MTVNSQQSGRRRINVTFHGVGPQTRALEAGEDRVWLSTEQLTAALDGIVGRTDVTVSFDDGNVSDLQVALPALRERALLATFFVVAGRLGSPGFLADEDVRALAAEGMTIGSHGMRHRSWRRLGDGELEEELVGARLLLEEVVGQPVTHAAIPFGAYDRRVLQTLRSYAYQRVFTSDRGPAKSNSWLQARNSLRKQDGQAELEHILCPAVPSWRQFGGHAKLLVKRWR